MLVASFFPNPMGGAETQCFRLSKNLIKEGYKVSIITMGNISNRGLGKIDGICIYRTFGKIFRLYLGIFAILNGLKKIIHRNNKMRQSTDALPYDPKDYGIKNNNVWIEGVEYFFYFLYAYFYLRKNKKQFDIIHVHIIPWISFVGAILGSIFKLPVIVKESTTVGLDKYTDLPFGNMMRNYCLRKCIFVAISKRIENIFIDYGIQKNRIYYIPNGIDIPEQVPQRHWENYTCLCVANLTQGAAKGIDVLLKAWPDVLSKYPKAQLNIVGEGDIASYDVYLRNLKIEKNVKFLGKISNLKNLYSETQLMVIPSRREGLSNSLLEGMSYGVPIIATAISGNEDLILSGSNGLLVPMDDPSAISRSILFYFENPRKAEEFGRKGYETLKKRCNFNEIVEKYISLYHFLCNFEKPIQ